MPAAIDKGIYFAFAERSDYEIHLYSLDFQETVVIDLHQIKPVTQQ